jgi:hypothetical protein
MQVGLADLNFVDQHIDRLDGDLSPPVPRLSSVSHEPYAEPGDAGAVAARVAGKVPAWLPLR